MSAALYHHFCKYNLSQVVEFSKSVQVYPHLFDSADCKDAPQDAEFLEGDRGGSVV